jgi:hypothetical protein
VEARLHLQDGRTIDISQDLEGRVACRARDVVLGDNVSMEIINEGTPDATRWLGLDRDSFASVVAVNQAQIMAVADSAAALQDHMQRAAATRGTDATAAEAIDRLKAFRKEVVGALRVGSTGPLWATMREQEAADAALAEARRQHSDYLDRDARLEEAAQGHARAEHDLAVAEAALALRSAQEVAGRGERAAALAIAYPQAPAPLATRDELADLVAAGLDAWRRGQAPVALTGPSAAELEAQLAALPALPAGDRRPDRSVTDAVRSLDIAEDGVRQLGELPPIAAAAPVSASPRAGAWSRPTTLFGIAGAVAGLALIALGQPVAGLAVLIAGVALGVWAWSNAQRRAGLGQPSAADRSRELASEWQARAARLGEVATVAMEAVRSALQSRGAAADGDIRIAIADYEAACAEREDLARAAAGAEGLRRAIEARKSAEASAARAQAEAAETETALRAAARHIGEDDAAPLDAVAACLIAWQGQRIELARASEIAIREWQELEGLLRGGTLTELQDEASRRTQVAARLVKAAGESSLLPTAEASEALVVEARAEVSRAKADVDALTGELRMLASTIPDVPEAEERADVARIELARVQDLAAVIDETLTLLAAAERRVHRDLAPILTESVQRHLPAITGGAYIEVGMNPRDLSVDVKEARTGQWRDARLLSEGTREQIYLLLRVAMAEHLVTTDETAPLLLDEVTAQSDPERKRRMLEVLHALSADRQVILFSHDAEVLDWAAGSLSEPRDRLIRLAAPAATPLAEAVSR